MLSHNQIKYINSLKIKKFRQQYNTFIVEGEKGVSELLNSTLKPLNIYALKGWLNKNIEILDLNNIQYQEITDQELQKISDLVTPNQVLAIAEIPNTENHLSSDVNLMTLMLDGIRDPGNMGTMIRTADWFGIQTIICSDDSVDAFSPKVVQSTMGSFGRVNMYYTNLSQYLKNLSAEVPVYGALLEAPAITKKTFSKPGIILIGSESHGISEVLIQYINEPVYIPRIGNLHSTNQAESLNASVANGIICYEICKQLYENNF
jgi:TrmH family RNA methyltransferase